MVELLVKVRLIENGYLISIGKKQDYGNNYEWNRETYSDELNKVGNTVVKFLSDMVDEKKKKLEVKIEKKAPKEK